MVQAGLGCSVPGGLPVDAPAPLLGPPLPPAKSPPSELNSPTGSDTGMQNERLRGHTGRSISWRMWCTPGELPVDAPAPLLCPPLPPADKSPFQTPPPTYQHQVKHSAYALKVLAKASAYQERCLSVHPRHRSELHCYLHSILIRSQVRFCKVMEYLYNSSSALCFTADENCPMSCTYTTILGMYLLIITHQYDLAARDAWSRQVRRCHRTEPIWSSVPTRRS